MPHYTATIEWALTEQDDFPTGRYSRGHLIRFDGGITLAGSASPHIVGTWAVPAAADPEELFIAALSSCHMLTFLDLARRAGFLVTAYTDEANGVMEPIAPDRHAVTRVTLTPRITWSGLHPSAEKIAQLHHAAHAHCFIANSVRTEVKINRLSTDVIDVTD